MEPIRTECSVCCLRRKGDRHLHRTGRAERVFKGTESGGNGYVYL